MIQDQLFEFTQAYLKAMYWADTGGEDQPSADAELALETKLDIEADCRSFWRRFGGFITAEGNCRMSDPIRQAGHDFYLTRNGHGAGFWDGDWSDYWGVKLTNASENYGEARPYLGDDGLIYI